MGRTDARMRLRNPCGPEPEPVESMEKATPADRSGRPVPCPGPKAAVLRIVVTLLLLAVASPVAADFEAGVKAYERGDYATALHELRPYAEQGNAVAQSSLGFMYKYGKGVPEDYEQAVFWFRQAAEQGYAKAQLFLGIMYDDGEGIPEDDEQAVFWYRQVAERGMAEAQVFLGIMYVKGEGVPKDYVRAYAWLKLAAAQGDDVAEQVRAHIRKSMTRTQVAEGQKLSRELAARIAGKQGG